MSALRPYAGAERVREPLKLDRAEIIRQQIRDGLTYSTIADMNGVSPAYIWNLAKRYGIQRRSSGKSLAFAAATASGQSKSFAESEVAAAALKLWSNGLDTLDIAKVLSTRWGCDVREHNVYNALNFARQTKREQVA